MGTGAGERFAAARAAWLLETTRRLAADERVGAALLAGSLGRRTSDQWSDVDLVVVIARGADELIVERDDFVRRFGTAVFVFDSPWNAPLDGAQVNALYEVDGDWPLYADWDLWPLERGAIPPDVRVLFDRVGLPATLTPLDEHRSWPRQPRGEPTPEHLRRARLAMLPIIAKCLVRADLDRAHRMLANLGYESDRTATDLLAATGTMWNDIRAGVDGRLGAVISRMLLVTSEAVAAGR